MEKLKLSLAWAVIASQATHIFCCVLPTVATLISLLAGAGLITAVPGFATNIHEALHDYETHLIIFSAVMLVLGWAFHLISERLDCRSDTGCSHEPCAPKKKKTAIILQVATAVLIINAAIYFGIH